MDTRILPTWVTEALGAQGAEQLRRAMEGALAAAGLALRIDGRQLCVEASTGTGELARIELDDLVRKAEHEPARVQPFLERMFASVSLQAAALGVGEVGRNVRVRLHPASVRNELERSSVPFLELLPGTVAALACDQGPDLLPIEDPHWAARTSAERRAILSSAIDRTVAMVSAKREDIHLPTGASLISWTGDEHITSTLALAAERLLSGDPRWGVLVAVPRSQIVVAHVIRDPTVVPAAMQLALMARGIFEEGPDPRVSPSLFWMRGGHWEVLDVEVDTTTRRATRFSPSQRFADEVLIPLA